MPPRIFASLDDFDLPQAGRGRVGRAIANHLFFRALLAHGTFDEYHFFLANAQHARQFQANHAALLGPLGDRVKAFTRAQLVDRLRDTDYAVFHQSDHVNGFNALCRLRDDVGAAVPVTAFVHSLSYPEQMGAYLEMTVAGAGACDGLVSSSACGRRVIEGCFARIAAGLSLPRAPVDVAVIPLGIAEEGAPPPKAAARAALGLSPDAVVGLCFGRFSDFDKMDLFPLLQALARATRGRAEPWRLVLAGAVHDDTYLKLVQLWVRALGLAGAVDFVIEPDEATKKALYAACDFFVSVADNPQETFGMTLLEALWSGLPLVVSDFDGYREIATDDVALRVPTTWTDLPELARLQPVMDNLTFHRLAAQLLEVDVGALAAALLAMYSDAGLRGRLGAAAARRFEAEYAHRRTIARLEAYWDGRKALARELGPRAPAGAGSAIGDPLCMSLFETFAHYVTRFSDDRDVVRATELSRQIAAAGAAYPLLPGMADVVDPAEIAAILGAAASPTTIGALSAGHEGRWKRRYVIAWMLKHELLERA